MRLRQRNLLPGARLRRNKNDSTNDVQERSRDDNQVWARMGPRRQQRANRIQSHHQVAIVR